jgi:site-specific DNA-methyltransferase (adenine-specific)/adenine-specific DNA-methyltransferase
MITKDQKDYIIKLLQEDKELPEDFKYQLFPTKQKEYELAYAGKMRKEDILANEDGVFPVPLQVEKVFNGNEYEAFDDDWKNMIVFGDNLQFLKTIYENKDPHIKDKVKGKVKLIYIDPPFATKKDFKGKDGQKAYTDKTKGSQFIEFLRKRLIVAKEILSDDGFIVIHLDQKKNHYIKVISDEIFTENNFVNEIIWSYRSGGASKKESLPKKHDNLLVYRKTDNAKVNPQIERQYLEKQFMDSKIDENGNFYADTLLRDIFEGVLNINKNNKILEYNTRPVLNLSTERIGYPTQKPEGLISLVMEVLTKQNDIVLDFFGGSGSTMAVAEKLGRKWITCDLGKLAYFTMQKRILQIQNSKDLEDPKKKYGKKAKSFLTASLGSYDLEKTFELERKKYLEFVSGLFEVDLKEYKVSGFSFEGKKDNYPAIIYDYNKYKDSSIDENYLQDLHRNIGKKVGSRVYIVAPINFVDFVDDFVEIDDVRYYFLKIPYHIINELHKKPFVKVRQPQSKQRVNDIEEAVGFHFKRPPEVKAEIEKSKDEIKLIIKSFKTNELQSDKAKDEKSFENFETLSAIFIDKNYNDKSFEIDEAFFADDLLPKKKSKKKAQIEDDKNNEIDENIIDDLKQLSKTGIEISLKASEVKNQIMVVFTDIYGNDFTQTFKI